MSVSAATVASTVTAAAPDTSAWDAGWLASASRIESPNQGPRPADARVTLAIVHSISLPPGVYGGREIEQLFTNKLAWDTHPYFERIRGVTVSAHFVVRRDGSLLQFVSCDRRAWHAGASSYRGVDNCNDYSVGIELEGLEGESFEAPQYATLARVLRALKKRYPIDAVVGHEHVAPGRKHDPGERFDWTALARRLRWSMSRFPFATINTTSRHIP